MIIDWAACRLGMPRCHREYRNGINFAICNYCDRQSEVHEFGGPRPRDVMERPPEDLDDDDHDRWHFVEVDCEFGGFRFICIAPEGAPCRMLPKCQHDGGGCVDYEGGHAIVCTAKDRVLIDTGECTVEAWINNGEECGRGDFQIPVTTEWNGDWWLWKPNFQEDNYEEMR
jgi:hypothetical protein